MSDTFQTCLDSSPFVHSNGRAYCRQGQSTSVQTLFILRGQSCNHSKPGFRDPLHLGMYPKTFVIVAKTLIVTAFADINEQYDWSTDIDAALKKQGNFSAVSPWKNF